MDKSLVSLGIKLAPKMNDLWNFYLDLYNGKENKILDVSLSQLSTQTGIDKGDLKNFLENTEKESMNDSEKELLGRFLKILYENMLQDKDFHDRLIAAKICDFDSILKEIKELLNEREKGDNKKTQFINMFKHEIESCIFILEQVNVQLLPDFWIKTVLSDGMKYFHELELNLLSDLSYKISSFNEMAKEEGFIVYPWKRLEYEDGHRLPIFRVRAFLKIRDDLKAELNKLKEAEWLNQ